MGETVGTCSHPLAREPCRGSSPTRGASGQRCAEQPAAARAHSTWRLGTRVAINERNGAPLSAFSPPSVAPWRLSPTAINRHRTCPKSYWFQYIAHQPRRREPSPTLAQPNAIHTALNVFFGIDPARRNVQVLHRALRSVWRRHAPRGTFSGLDEEADYGNAALSMLSTFAASFDTTAVPAAREQWLTYRLTNGVQLIGKADRIDVLPGGGLSIIDYKTGAHQLTDDELADEPAAMVYAVAAQAITGRPVERVRYVYLRTADEARWEPEPEDIEATQLRLRKVTDAIRADSEFERNPGDACTFCPFRPKCMENRPN